MTSVFSRLAYLLTLSFSLMVVSRALGRESVSVGARYSAPYGFFNGQTIGASGATVINFFTKDYDTGNNVSNAGSNWKFTAPVAGKYMISSQVQISSTFSVGDGVGLFYQVAPSGYEGYLDLRKFDVVPGGSPVAIVSLSGAAVHHLNKGDTIQFEVYNDSINAQKIYNLSIAYNVASVVRIGD